MCQRLLVDVLKGGDLLWGFVVCCVFLPPIPTMIFLFLVRPLVLPKPVSLYPEGVLDSVLESVLDGVLRGVF